MLRTLLSIAMYTTAAHALGNNLKKLKRQGNFGSSTTVRVHTGSNPDYELDYFTLRSLADLPVLMLEFTETPYAATYYNRQDFLDLVKEKLPTGRLPVLRHHGLEIAQSSTIVRYIASQTGLAGEGPSEQFKVDMAYETIKELFSSHQNIRFNATNLQAGLHDFMLTGNKIPHFRNTANRAEYDDFTKSAVVLKTFDDWILEKKNGGPFLVGHRPTYADLALFLELEKAHESDLPNLLQVLTSLHLFRLREHYMEFNTNFHVSQYLSSDRRMPRFERRNGDYQYLFPHVPGDEDVEKHEDL